MPPAAKTALARLMVGGATWLADCSPDTPAFDVAGSLNLERDTNLGSEAVGATGTGISVDINVPSMFYGAVTEALQAHQDDAASAYVGAFAPGIGSYFGPVIWANDAIDGPTSGIVVSNFAFLGSGAMSAMYGPVAAVPFTLSATSASVALGMVPADANLLVIFDEVTNNFPDTDITVATRNISFLGDPCSHPIVGPTAAGAQTIAGVVSGSSVVSGFVLIGLPMELD